MPEHAITLVAPADAAESVQGLVNAILRCWPAGEPTPVVRAFPLDELLVLPEGRAEQESPIEDSGAVVAVLPAGTPGVAAYKLVDRLQRWSVPGLLLAEAPDARTAKLQSGGIVVRAWDAPPEFLAATLFALAERQGVVRSLSRELRIATRYSGGVRGEIDRIHDELNLAAAVQQEMLPRQMPEVSALECGFLFRPVGYVSGDIYDVAPLDDRHVAFFVADAVGHGVPAALMTMVISRSLRLVRTEGGVAVPPGEVLSRLNADLLRGRRHAARFGTAVYGVIDTTTMRVRVSGAGHPYPVVIRRGGRPERVPLTGALLGIFPDERYEDAAFDLGPDDTLLLFSDGLEAAFANPLLPDRNSAARKRGATAYLQELERLAWPDERRGISLGDSIGALSGLLDAQAGSLHQADDITIVAVRRVGEAVGSLMDADTQALYSRDAA